jgi:HK97 family phage prohead protease
VPVKYKSRTNRGFVVEGVGCKYSTIIYHDRLKYICIEPGAFDVSLRYEPVECWIDHDSKLALTGCRVETYSDELALNFRVALDDSEIAGHARDLVESGLYNQASLSWHSSKTVTRTIDGTDVTFILQGTLTHIALVPAAAINSFAGQRIEEL